MPRIETVASAAAPTSMELRLSQGILKGEGITVPLTSSLTGLGKSVLQIKTKNVSCHTADPKPVKQEVVGTVIPSPFSIPWPRRLAEWKEGVEKKS